MTHGFIVNLFAIFAGDGSSPIDKDDLVHRIFPENPWDVVIQVSSFVILLLIVFFVAYKPVRKLLAKRKEYVDTMVADAENNNRIAKEAAANKDKVVEEGKQEAARIIADAQAQAALQANAIVNEAKQEASRKRAEADREIEAAKEASLLEVKDSIVDVAIAASSQVLEREVSKEDNERLIKDFVDGIRGEDGEGK